MELSHFSFYPLCPDRGPEIEVRWEKI